ncbi:MAG: hypothetical protein WC603_02820 [Candidatus Paceibacterota bacterium]|jgi:hypothetical protein
MKKIFFLFIVFSAFYVSALKAEGTDSLSLSEKFFSKFTEVTVSYGGIAQSRLYFTQDLDNEKETNLICFPSKFIQLNGGANITVRSLKTVHVFTLAIFDLSFRLKNGYYFHIPRLGDLEWDAYVIYSKSFCDFGSENNFSPKFHWGTNYLGVGLECPIPGIYTSKDNPLEIVPFFEIGNDFRGNILPILGFRINFPHYIWER